MKCMNCYQEISDSCKFCPNCGAKQPVQKMEPVSQVKEETIDNITEDTAEVQQPTEKVQSEEDVQPEEKTIDEYLEEMRRIVDHYDFDTLHEKIAVWNP